MPGAGAITTPPESAARPPASAPPAALHWHAAERRVECSGHWTFDGLRGEPPAVERLTPGRWQLLCAPDLRLDTAGAWVLYGVLERARGQGAEIDVSALPRAARELLALMPPPAQPADAGTRLGKLEGLGARAWAVGCGAVRFLDFVGACSVEAAGLLLRPWRLRWRQVAHEVRLAGVGALPIVGLLAFLLGVVMAYQGGEPLRQFGATVFLIDLVSLGMFREMAPLMTAVIVAGRTGAAYTAQIGTMRVTQELDALRSFGITPNEMLVLPKMLALAIVMPLLTVVADALGVFGGALVADAMYGIALVDFMDRVPDAVDASSFWVGVLKAPVFALAIALVSCYQGLCVQGSAASVGVRTTQSVVLGIFLVIVLDAAFSIVFQKMGL